jgi:MFS family permease
VALIAGYDGALIASLLANPRFFAALGNPSATKLGLIVASQSMGTIPGLIPSAILSDMFGRRVGQMCGYLILMAGANTLAFASPIHPNYMIAGRVIIGFGSGMTTVAGAPYTAEIAHPRIRPQATALVQTCFFIGSVASAFIALGTFKGLDNDWSWRLPLLLHNVMPITVLSIIWFVQWGVTRAYLRFVPESPRWLVNKGRVEQAHQILAKYHANGKMDDELVMWELREIEQSIKIEQEAKSTTFSTFFKTKGNRWRLGIIVTTGLAAQWVGNGIITFYIVAILNTVGITDPVDQTIFNGCLQIWNGISAMAGALVCERFGRRKMWLTSIFGQFVSYAVITLGSALFANGNSAAAYPVLAFLYIYFSFYAIAVSSSTGPLTPVHSSPPRLPDRDPSVLPPLEGRLPPPHLLAQRDPHQHVH